MESSEAAQVPRDVEKGFKFGTKDEQEEKGGQTKPGTVDF